MKRLIVMRHATTVPSAPGGDAERSLTEAGHAEAERIGRWLAAHGHVPQAAVCSTARRVRETWAGVERGLGATPPADFDESVYLATSDELRQIASELDDGSACAMLVGHNPAVSHLAFELTERHDPAGRERLRAGFRPGTVAVLEVAADSFAALAGSGATLVDYVSARDVE
jgi:phosphohistidine phosphatase